jgi:allantoinase
MRYDLAIHAERAITNIGERSVTVCVRDGVIVDLLEINSPVDAYEEVRLDGVLFPGLVDTHVHINEPGRTSWEGFATATKAAAAGGVTTLIDMPLNSIPPTVDVSALTEKKNAAEGKCVVDVGFWGGSIPGNTADLLPLLGEGVFGFKCFLLHSGVDEFPESSVDDLATALKILAAVDALMVVHAEDSTAIRESETPSSRKYQDFLASRPKGAENVAIANLIEQARRTGARVHVLHLSSADALDMIASARKEGVRISAETCPHYLALTAEGIADGATQYKCCPPIRERSNQDLLWQGLFDDVIGLIVSDHSPCTADLKNFEVGDFQSAWGGISSLQLGLPIIWTEARKRGVSLFQVATWMSAAPSALAGLDQKGAIAVGKDADFSLFHPDKTFTVDPRKLHHRNPITPYAGKVLNGVVAKTWLRGKLIYAEGDIIGTPSGSFLRSKGRLHV